MQNVSFKQAAICLVLIYSFGEVCVTVEFWVLIHLLAI